MEILATLPHLQDDIKVIRGYEETDWSRIRPLPSTNLRKSEESHSEMVEDSAAKSRFVYQARPRRQQDIEYGTVPKPMVDITGSGKAVSLPDPKSNDGFEDAGYLTGDHLAQKKDSNFEVVTPNNTMSDQAGADCDQ